MNRAGILNSLIHKIGAKHYLEIGSFNGETFDQILCLNRVSVDPQNPQPKSGGIHHNTDSDDFFQNNVESFDVIFIDGLHHADQVYKDIENSLNFLNEGGVIVCHDMNPIDEKHQRIPFSGGTWNGDCWKALVNIRKNYPDLHVSTVDTDHGCSIITRILPANPIMVSDDLTYENLDKNRKSWLNLIDVQQFVSSFGVLDSIESKLSLFASNPCDPEYNFILGLHYDSMGHKASAISYYVRTAERTESLVFQYECLIKAATCFDSLGMRALSVKGLLDKAITILPRRPEAYFLLSRWYERQRTIEGWLQSYLTASLAIEFCDKNDSRALRTNIDYPGFYGLLFEKAVSGWWIGQCEESCKIFIDLHKSYALDYSHRSAVLANLKQLNQFQTKEIRQYKKEYHDRLKFKFPGSENIVQNFSESYQDMFVLSVLNGKRNGTFLEIGSARPFYGNNTALLEKEFGWSGIAIDLDKGFVEEYQKARSSKCHNLDALEIDYEKFLQEQGAPKEIDYLQIDIDPADVSLKCLKKIPFDTRKFSVITFEHDGYTQLDPSIIMESRITLCENGYTPIVKNIAPDHWRYYEDWWIHNDLLETRIGMIDGSNEVKSAESYMLNP